MHFIHWILLTFLRRILKATHSVIAVLTQVIASNEEGHELPVVLKIHSLVTLKAERKNQTKKTHTAYDKKHEICFS